MSDSLDLFVVEKGKDPTWICSAESLVAAHEKAKAYPNKQCDFLIFDQKADKKLILKREDIA